MSSKAMTWAVKRLAKLDTPPEKCTDKQLQKIIDTYSDYLDAMCNEDGYVHTYDRVSENINPWFEEHERRQHEKKIHPSVEQAKLYKEGFKK